MYLKQLAEPFREDEIEWRISQCGVSGKQIWGMCVAYISARAIMDRLDLVCGPENWRVWYEFINGQVGSVGGVVSNLSIKTGEEWVTKQDGAEQTDIESFKGGISSALKRAGSVWGMGRYLYSLEVGFAAIVEKGTPGALYGKTKDNQTFYWLPPKLPSWALPKTAPPEIAGSQAGAAASSQQNPPKDFQNMNPQPKVKPKVQPRANDQFPYEQSNKEQEEIERSIEFSILKSVVEQKNLSPAEMTKIIQATFKKNSTKEISLAEMKQLVDIVNKLTAKPIFGEEP